MAAPDPQDIWGRVGDGTLGAAIAALGAILLAVVNRKSPLAALVNEQLRLLIESQRRQIESLLARVTALEEELAAVRDELDAERRGKRIGL